MKFILRIIVRIVLNGFGLYAANTFITGFTLSGGTWALALGAGILALFNTFLKPLAKSISAPLIWMTFGMFIVVIHAGFLWIADALLPSLAIDNIYALVLAAVIMALANAFI